MTEPVGFTVAFAQTSRLTPARQFAIDLLAWLDLVGRRGRVAVLRDEGEVTPLLRDVADVRVMGDLRARSPLGLVEGAARRRDPSLADPLRRARLGPRRRWLEGTDVVHLNSPQAVSVLRWLSHPPSVVTTYAHADDLAVWDLAPADRDLLLARTDRFIAASQDMADELAQRCGLGPDRVEVRDRPVVGPRPDLPPAARAAARRALGLSSRGPLVAVPPVVDWGAAPDLTLALAWELRRRAPSDTPHILWLGAPADRARRWPMEQDVDRIGLRNVHLLGVDAIDPDPLDLADLVVLPSQPSPPGPVSSPEASAMRGTPVLCWDNHPAADVIRSWTGRVVPYPDVEQMATEVLDLLADGDARRCLAEQGRSQTAADTDAVLSLLGVA